MSTEYHTFKSPISSLRLNSAPTGRACVTIFANGQNAGNLYLTSDESKQFFDALTNEDTAVLSVKEKLIVHDRTLTDDTYLMSEYGDETITFKRLKELAIGAGKVIEEVFV